MTGPFRLILRREEKAPFLLNMLFDLFRECPLGEPQLIGLL
jgi:hypothetical protein